MISNQQSIDNNLLSYYKKFQPDWTTNGWVMTKKSMPIYGIIDILRVILACNLAKCQYCSIRPGLEVPLNYIFSAIFSSISCKMWILCPKSYQFAFFRKCARYVMNYNSGQATINILILNSFLGVKKGNSADTKRDMPPKTFGGISAKILRKFRHKY